MSVLDKQNIQFLKGVGKARSKLFSKLGADSVGAVLRLYPRDYADWTNPVLISKAPNSEPCCVRAIVSEAIQTKYIREGMTLYKTCAKDESGTIYITFFNNPYAANQLVKGLEYIFFGTMSGMGNVRELTSPVFRDAESGKSIHPIYHLTSGLSQKMVERVIKNALLLVNKETMPDLLSQSIREKNRLPDICYSLNNIHFPLNEKALDLARRRLIFEELLLLQLGMLMMKSRNRKQTELVLKKANPDDFFRLLPFTPTNAQLRAVYEALEDMSKDIPMSRLLQGDVGSGKTAVAAALCYCMAKGGMQSAIMAPTEILANQHYNSIQTLLKDTGVKVELLTGSMPNTQKKKIKELLKIGLINILVGTHALISDNVEFDKLGLVITDEQHRFGVSQRAALSSKGKNPHVLVMSATPIPRTLALMIYGDLDISVLDELPRGRQRIETYSIDSSKRVRAFNYVKKHMNDGFQAYIVCPLVEEGEQNIAAATEYFEQLKTGLLSGYKIGLLHGRMKSSEKESVMLDFMSGEVQALVCTTVIEVGVDVPNAVIIVIENAERFGLSQLHQLRGRVGRSSHKSTCILISDAQNKNSEERMKIMCSTNDGFEIAAKDLNIRGPGDFFGARQHGLPQLKIADMANDSDILKSASDTAKEIIRNDPDLNSEENKNLKEAVSALFVNAEVLN